MQKSSATEAVPRPSTWRDYFELGKPKVVALIVFTAVVGMFLAVPGLPPWQGFLFGTIGIGLAASSAAAINHVLDRGFDEKMARTRNRPIPTGHVTSRQALTYAGFIGVLSMLVLWLLVNPLTAVLTFFSLIGYAVLYTVWLKHITPQNIVIGGAAGAAPPVLGWVAITGTVDPYALLLFLIIFAWTPPHFWALAIARRKEYAQAGIPMLPVAYGVEFTRLHILLYTIILFIVTLLPYLTGMSGLVYLLAAVGLGVIFTRHALALRRPDAPDHLPMTVFRYSINYLMLLFAALLIDHYVHVRIWSGPMASRSHFAAPLLLAVVTGLIFYVSLYPFRFVVDGPSLVEAMQVLTWARASRGDMFNNFLLYVPFGFCVALLIEPRWGRLAGIVLGAVAGAGLSTGLELLQASVAPRVSSLTDVSLNATGSLVGAVLGSGFHALGSRMAPQSTPRAPSGSIALFILVLWLIERLWPLIPDPGLRQLRRAVRPLLTPSIEWMDLAGFFIGWLVVAQAVFHLAKRQRGVDVFLIVIATVLVGRAFVAGSVLVAAEIAALALLFPVLVLLNRLEDGMRSTLVALLLGTWLAWSSVRPLVSGSGTFVASLPAFKDLLLRNVPAPPLLAYKGFSFLSLAWLLAGAGLMPHIAAGMTVLFVCLLVMLQLGAAAPLYGWVDILIALVAGWIVARWITKG